MKSDHRFSPRNRVPLVCFIILFLLFIALSAIICVLYVRNWSPKRFLFKLGFPVQQETNYSVSWDTLSQLDYDSDALFIGDSLTIGENFQERFNTVKIINIGLAGDTLSGIKSRSYIIPRFKPEKIFIEGGINSLKSYSVDSIATEYEEMIRQISEQNVNSRLFIQSVLPISNNKQAGGCTNTNIVELNDHLKSIAEKYGAVYIDLYSVYVLSGEMNPEYTIDGVHLKDEAKSLWLDALTPYLTNY